MKAQFIRYLVLLATCFWGVCGTNDAASDETEENIFISPNCAAVMYTASSMGQGIAFSALAAYFTPAALCTAGFCPAGIAGNSFASWWQSKLPYIVKGSLFANLQSIAMSGGLISGGWVTASVLGGVVSASYIKELCAFVDQTDPNSSMGQVFDKNTQVAAFALKTQKDITDACASSETCSAATETVSKTAAQVWSGATSLWNSVSSGASKVATHALLRMEIYEIETDLVEHVREYGRKTFQHCEKMQAPCFNSYLEKIYNDVSEEIRNIEATLHEEQSKEDASDYVIRSLQKIIEQQKGAFGINVFMYLHMTFDETAKAMRMSQEDGDLQKMFNDMLKEMRTTQKDRELQMMFDDMIKEMRMTQKDGELQMMFDDTMKVVRTAQEMMKAKEIKITELWK